MASRKKMKLISIACLLFFLFSIMGSTVSFADGPTVVTLERAVAKGSDDAEEFSSGGNKGRTMTTSTDLEMIHDSGSGYSEDQLVGIRFENITIPKGATVTNAYIQFTAKSGTGEATLYIKAENVDNAQTFVESTVGTTSTYYNIANRSTTTAQVTWTPAAWNTDGQAGENQRTPNLNSLIQEVIDREGWESGNAIAFIISGEPGQCRNAYSYEGGAAKAPKLFVEYTIPEETQEPVDETLPTWPDGSEITVSNLGVTTVTLGWPAATDDAGITGYRIYKDGQLLATVNGNVHSYSVIRLTKGTDYTFKVEAGDADGNWTTDGPEVQITTHNYNNIALGKPATASGQIADFSPSMAVDGISFDFNNVWADDPVNGNPCWLQIDLKDQYVIKMIEIDDRHGDSWDWPRKAFEIRVSNDPEFNTYEVLGGIANDGTPMIDDATWVLSVNNKEGYRYVRYARTIGTNPLGHTYVTEFKVYGILKEEEPEAVEVNVALNKPTRIPDYDTARPDYSPAKAVDGIGGEWTNGWAPKVYDGVKPWIQIDLEDAYVINRIQIDDRPYDGQDGRDNWDGPRKYFEVWASNDPDFGTYAVLGAVGSTAYDGYVWSHDVNDTNAYRYIRYVRTNTGYTFLSELRVFTLVTAPLWAKGSAINISGLTDKGVTLQWPAAADEKGVTAYKIYKDGKLLNTVAGNVYSYEVTGLEPGVEYTFKVEAVNSFGVESTKGPSVAVTTESGLNLITEGCSQIIGTDLENNQLVLRMKGLSASFTINNYQRDASTFTVTVKNVDPDYVTISKGTIVSKGVNSFVFTLDVPTNGSVSVDIEPWYQPDPDNFYFIAWSDNQDGTSTFKNKLIPKASLINPIFTVSAGDLLTGTASTIGGAGSPELYGYPNDYVKDSDYLGYLSLIENYPVSIFETAGNHDLPRGGWVDKDDSRYGHGEAMFKKYLGDVNYYFDVGNTRIILVNFHYDMPNWTKRWGGNIDKAYLGLGTRGWQQTLPNDDVGDALYEWLDTTLSEAADKTNRISVSHHNFSMFIPDGNTVAKARSLYKNRNVSYMISGHSHSYQTGTDSETGIPYLVTGDAQKSNPGFSLVHVNGSQITEQHMFADNLNLNVTYNTPNNGTSTQGSATITCSGYNLPFIRLKFKMSNAFASYIAKDADTGESLAAFSKQFSDYTVVYVETSINNGATRNVQILPEGDDTAPVWPDGSELTASEISGTGLTLSWTEATDNNAVTAYRIYKDGVLLDEVDGDVYSYDVTGLEVGTEYTFKVEAGDASGNWSEDGPSVTVETLPYITPVTVNISIDYDTNMVTISGNAFFGEGKEVTVLVVNPLGATDYLDQVTSGADGSYEFTYKIKGETEGTYRVYVGGTGIVKPVETTFVYKKPVTVTVSASVNNATGQVTISGYISSGQDKRVTVKVINPEGTIDYLDQIISGENGYYEFSYKLDESVEGTYTVYVGGTDVNELAETTFTFVPEEPAEDTTAPTWPAGSKVEASEVGQTSLKLTWTAAEDDTAVTGYKIYKGEELLDTVAADVYTYNVTGLAADTTYTFTVQAVDAAGNESEDGPSVTVTTEKEEEPVEDTTAPTWPAGSKVEATEVGQTSLKLTWTAAEDDTAVAGYKIYKGEELLDTVAADVYTYNVTGLAADTTYTFTVQAVDAAGNESEDGPSVTVTTEKEEEPVEDTTAPTWPAGSKVEATEVSQTSLKLTWTAAEDDTAVTGYKIYKGEELLDTVAADVYTYNVTGLAADTTYTFTVQAVDAAGNESEDGPSVTVTTRKPSGGGVIIIPPISEEEEDEDETTVEVGNDGTITAKPVLGEDNKAVIDITEEDINKAAENAPEDAEGTKEISIKVEKVDGAEEYVQGIPVSALTDESANKKYIVETEFGTIEVPSNMLTTVEAEGSETAYLSIRMADKNELSEELKNQIGERPVIELKLKLDGKEIAWSNNNAPVTVSIPYEPTEEELKDPEHIVVWYIDGEGNVISIPSGKYDPETGMVTFTTTHFSKYAVAFVKKTFDDIANYAWAKKEIEVMASKGIINGTSATTFNPSADITRADFIVLLARALGLDAEIDDNFSDVNPDAYYAKQVGIARKLGIAKGSGNNEFRPNDKIERQEMMTLIDRALKVAGKGLAAGIDADLEGFADKDMIASYATDSVAALVKSGIIKGDGTNINPLGNTTRAEAAVVIYRIYNMLY